MVSVWMPRNRIRPRIITSSPMMSLPRRGWFARAYPRIILGAWCAMRQGPPSRLAGLPAEVAIVDIADRDRPPRERAAESRGEFQRLACLQRRIDRLQVCRAGIRRGAGSGVGYARDGDDLA